MLCLQSVFCGSTSRVADYRFVRSDQDSTDFTDLQITDLTDVTDIQITDCGTFYDVQITEVQIVDYGCY